MRLHNQQRKAGIRRGFAFSPLFLSHLNSHDYDFYPEGEFNSLIHIERKRTERSGKPFLLMLVDVKAFEKQKGKAKVMEKIAYTLCSCSRKIDIKGWYRRGAVFGVVFTEIARAAQAVNERIMKKMLHGLSLTLRPDELQKVKISLHPYPENPEEKPDDRNVFDLYLYPDLSRKNRINRMSLALKRLFDILGSACALVLLSPLFLIIAAAVRLSSEGPIFYRQTRVGLAGEEFTFLKFRSMFVNNDPNAHIDYIKRYINGDSEDNGDGKCVPGKSGVYKITDDPRVTPIGKLLRRLSLDELPQFINVLRGDMSVVGPRPPIPYECDNYETWHRERVLGVKPGLTGLWQVRGRSRTAFNDMVRLDLQYARERSFWLDLKILLETPAAVLCCKGAY